MQLRHTANGVRSSSSGSSASRPVVSNRKLSVKCTAAAVVFQCKCHVNYGEAVLVTGAEQALGAWNPASALALNWGDGDVWSSEAELPSGTTFEYKFIVKRKDGFEWQQGANKSVTVPADASRVELLDQFTGGAQTKVSVVTAAVVPAVPAVVEMAAEAAAAPPVLEVQPGAPALGAISDLEAKIHDAEIAAASYEADKAVKLGGSIPVSTVENIAVEEIALGHGQLANNIVQGIPAGVVPVSSAPDAQTAYEEADKFEVLEVGAQSGAGSGVQSSAARVGPGALDHLTVNQLRSELKRRGLPSNGNRRKLITTLQDAGAL